MSVVKLVDVGGFLTELVPVLNTIVADMKIVAALVKDLKQDVTFADMKGSAITDGENSDENSLPTNGSAVAAQSAVSTTWAVGALTNPDVARSVCISVENDSGGPLNLYEGVMSFTVVGTLNGVAQTEVITITSSSGNKAIANTKFRYKYGSKAFSTVTGITLDNVSDDAIKFSAGLGSKLHIPNVLQTPAEADVLKVSVDAADYTITGKVDTTNNTLNVGAIADGADVFIAYVSNGTSVIASNTYSY